MDAKERGGAGARSSSWRTNRLKPATDEFGFVSKGDTRFHAQIVDKYIAFCGSSDSSADLDRKFSSLAFNPNEGGHGGALHGKNARYANSQNAELSSLLLQMRKLREGIVASNRIDAFVSEVYAFSIRAAILMKHVESYHPALLHLLQTIHPVVPLSASELQEFAGYYMLHLACNMENYSEAFVVKQEYGVTNSRITQAVMALIHNNYWSFRAMRRKVDLYNGRLLEDGEKRIRLATLKCLGKTYFTVEVSYVETVMGMGWEDLKREYQVGWQVDDEGEIATVRKPKKPAAPSLNET
ncbi:hypothetical protein RUND412_008422 [Rhizina undulata]